MAFDEKLAHRIRLYFKKEKIYYTEKKMFGGCCFMVDNKFCVGVDKDRLIARVGKSLYLDTLSMQHCAPFDIRTKPLKGFVIVTTNGIRSDNDLALWIQKCLTK